MFTRPAFCFCAIAISTNTSTSTSQARSPTRAPAPAPQATDHTPQRQERQAAACDRMARGQMEASREPHKEPRLPDQYTYTRSEHTHYTPLHNDQ